ncbi:4-hydroxythreonine-4-phosphate dehydrogenase PdxA [Spirosoma arcticum]
MEQRQPDESNEPRTNPSPEQLSDSQPTNTQLSAEQLPTEDRDAAQRDAAQRDAAQPNPDQRNDRQQNSRANGGPRDGGPRNDRSRDGGPRDGGPAQKGQNQRDAAPRGDAQRDRGQRDAAPRNEGNSNTRDRTTDGRERGRSDSSENRTRDDRSGRGSAQQRPAIRPSDAGPDSVDDFRDADGPDNQTTDSQGRDERLVIGISLGDYNGIGPEVILKALQYNRLQKLCTPVIYGSMRILNRYRNLLDLKDWNLNGAPTVGQISHKLTNVITCWPDQSQDIQPGQVTPEAGQAALACLQRAVDDLKDGKLDALVTAPINKYNIQSEEFQFPGHTEYLAQQFGITDNLMFMVSDILRVGVVTGHVPLGRVRQNVTRERIAQKLALMMQSLKQDFGIEKPKIAVLGLNPHAGEEGLLGNEEQDIIKPLLTDLRNKGQLVFGPYPADGFFGTRNYKNFDAVLAMYHDQGLIPFKAIAFEEGVNFTAGMPVVRTSPDHGTAYDIAGKDLADESSMLQAIYTAIDVARQRKEFMELEAGALKRVSK